MKQKFLIKATVLLVAEIDLEEMEKYGEEYQQEMDARESLQDSTREALENCLRDLTVFEYQDFTSMEYQEIKGVDVCSQPYNRADKDNIVKVLTDAGYTPFVQDSDGYTDITVCGPDYLHKINGLGCNTYRLTLSDVERAYVTVGFKLAYGDEAVAGEADTPVIEELAAAVKAHLDNRGE